MTKEKILFVSAPYYLTFTVDAIPSISCFASTREGTLGVGAVCIFVAVMLSCFALVYKSATKS